MPLSTESLDPNADALARRRAVAGLLAAGVLRVAAAARAAALSAGRSSDNPADTPPSELALPADKSVTVHAG
jgi:hypothetical protein